MSNSIFEKWGRPNEGISSLSPTSATLLVGVQAPPGTAETIVSLLPEAASLVTLVRATEGAACAVYEVGPVANHLVGITSAVRPDYHPNGQSDVPNHPDALIRYICQISDAESLSPRYPDLRPPSDLLYVIPGISDGAVSRPPRNDMSTQILVQDAIRSGDPDKALPILEGRLASLMSLCDRARASGGGTIDSIVDNAVRTLAKSLVGPGRWQIPAGWERSHHWPVSWRYGYAAIRAHTFLLYPEIEEVVLTRLLEGNSP
jgi:hypothetical protein